MLKTNRREKLKILISRKIRLNNRLSEKEFYKIYPNAVICYVGMPPMFKSPYHELKPSIYGKKVKFWKVVRQHGRKDDDGYIEWCVPIFFKKDLKKKQNIIHKVIRQIFLPPTREDIREERIEAKKWHRKEIKRRKREDKQYKMLKSEINDIMDRHSDHFH
jgi:hypothetical protein